MFKKNINPVLTNRREIKQKTLLDYLWWGAFLLVWGFGALLFLACVIDGDSAALPLLGLALLHSALVRKYRQIWLVVLAIMLTGYIATNPHMFEGTGLKITAYEKFKKDKPEILKNINKDVQEGNYQEALKKIDDLEYTDEEISFIRKEIIKLRDSAKLTPPEEEKTTPEIIAPEKETPLIKPDAEPDQHQTKEEGIKL